MNPSEQRCYRALSGVLEPLLRRSILLKAGVVAVIVGLGISAGSGAGFPNDPAYDVCGEAAPHAPNNPPANGSCSFNNEQWPLYGFTPRNAQLANTLGNQNSPPLQGSGLNADGAWATTHGRSDVVIAILDSGIRWSERDLTEKIYLNRGELPLPEGAQCTSPGAYDCNGDGVFNVKDYTGDPRVADANSNGFIDPEDLIRAFSDGIDTDGNGFIDDIAGWDTFRNDNDPLDDVDFGHGTGRADDAAAQTDNALGGAGVCPNCMIMPVRVGDSFVVSSHTWSQGVVFAVDNGAAVLEDAIGTVTMDAFTKQALDYAWSHNVLPVVASADEDSFHHSPPSNLNHALSVKAIIPDTVGADSTTHTFLNHPACTNFGGHIHVAVPTPSCSSGATSLSAGMVGLIESRAREVVLSPALTANEAKQIVTMTADDINIPGSGTTDTTKYPSHPGWDQYFGYGRVNAGRAVAQVTAATIPPEADILTPAWFDIIDPMTSPSVAISGHFSAVRATSYSYVVQCAVGVEPTDAQFALVTLASGGGVTAPMDGILATWSPGAQCTPANVNGTPSAPDDFTVTLRVRVTDNLGNVGEDRKTLSVHHDPTLRAGFPLDLGVSGESSVALVDLDGDNALEIIAAAGDGRVYAFHQDGSPVVGFPVSADPIPAVKPGDPASHLASPAYMSGAVVPSPDSFVGSVAVGDLLKNGRQVIVAASLYGNVYAWFGDGTRVPGFPVSVDRSISANPAPGFEPYAGIVASPAIGDLDPTYPGQEIVVGALDQHLYAWHADGTPVTGFPMLVNSPNPATFAADDCGENKIVSSPALGDVDKDGKLEIVIGTNEAFTDSGNCGDQLNGSGRVYVVSNTGAIKTVISPHSRVKPTVLPGIGQGVPASPALADIDGDGYLEIAVPAIGSQPDADPIIFRYNGAPFHTLTSSFSNASSTDSPFLSFLGNPSFGDLNGDGKPDLALGGVGYKLLLRFAYPNNRMNHDHLISAWDATTGSFISGFPRKIEDWQFLTDPTIANVDGSLSGPQVLEGSGGYLLHAISNGGAEPAGWPKFTDGWISSAAAVGDLSDDGSPDVVLNTRDGKLFAWSTTGQSCQNTQWWRFHHDEADTGLYGFDSRRPDAVRDLSIAGANLQWTAPGNNARCGLASRYELRYATSPITEATWPAATTIFNRLTPQSAGSTEQLAMPPFSPGSYYIAIRADDASGNIGAVSNVVSIVVPCNPGDADCDGMPDTYENAHSCLNPAVADANGDADGDTLTNIVEMGFGTDPCSTDSDTDGCADNRELGSSHTTGGQRDPTIGSDFFDVPAPALLPANTTGTRNRAISIQDVIAIVAYIGTSAANPNMANVNGAKYGSDLNNNGVQDGQEYDRAPGPATWAPAPPSGAVTIADALIALNSVGDNCN